MIRIKISNKYSETLVGLKQLPLIRKEKYPTIILVHGFKSTKQEEGGMFDDLSNILCKNDFWVFRFDFSGCGESEGDFSEPSLSKLKSDLLKILKYVKSQKDVDVSKIGILAYSFGSVVTIVSNPKIKCFVLMGVGCCSTS